MRKKNATGIRDWNRVGSGFVLRIRCLCCIHNRREPNLVSKSFRTGVQTLLETQSKNSSPSGFPALWISLLQYQFIIPCSFLIGYNPFITTSMHLKIIFVFNDVQAFLKGLIFQMSAHSLCSPFVIPNVWGSSPGHHPAPPAVAGSGWRLIWRWLPAGFFPGCWNPVPDTLERERRVRIFAFGAMSYSATGALPNLQGVRRIGHFTGDWGRLRCHFGSVQLLALVELL